jgi:hypothetical protein
MQGDGFKDAATIDEVIIWSRVKWEGVNRCWVGNDAIPGTKGKRKNPGQESH